MHSKILAAMFVNTLSLWHLVWSGGLDALSSRHHHVRQLQQRSKHNFAQVMVYYIYFSEIKPFLSISFF
jgi:hypothetical protein